MKTSLLCLAILVALTTAQECNNPQPFQGQFYFWQDGDCSVETPYCTYRGSNPEQQTCTKCRIGGFNGGLGSCNCDPRTHFCKQGGSNAGSCRPYTKLNDQCSIDKDCQTRINAITTITPVVQTEDKLDESLSCVFGRCKPCDPDLWRDHIGDPGTATVTCAGYNAAVSDDLDRYVVETSRPRFEFTCTILGDIEVVNDTIDYNFGFPGGDRSEWTPSATDSTSATTSGGTTTSGSGSTTAGGDATSAGWGLLQPALLALVAVVALQL